MCFFPCAHVYIYGTIFNTLYTDLPGTERIPVNKPRRPQPPTTTTPAPAKETRPAASNNRRPTNYPQYGTWQSSVPRYTQPTASRYTPALPALPLVEQNTCCECLDDFHIQPSKWENPWQKCLCHFYVLCKF